MFTAAGFERTWEYIDLFKEGLICTVSLSLLTVIFGFVLALLLPSCGCPMCGRFAFWV